VTKEHSLRIAEGGEDRLREAIKAKLRAKYLGELPAASDRKERAEIKRTIQQELEQEMKRVASPYSLWGSR
jgi:hypothetical protein